MTFDKSPEWQAQALRGVEKPIPPSLRFLEDQGAWFTPFNRPGMRGRYDLRGMHVGHAPNASKAAGEASRPTD